MTTNRFVPQSTKDRWLNVFRRVNKTITGVEQPTALAVTDDEGNGLLGNSISYENKSFSIADGVSNQNTKTVNSLFGTVTTAKRVSIRTTSTISVKFNSSSNDAIVISASESPMFLEGLLVSNIFISNSSGATATVQIFIC